MSTCMPRFSLNITSALLAATGIVLSHTAIAHTELVITPSNYENVEAFDKYLNIKAKNDNEVIGISSETTTGSQHNIQLSNIFLDFEDISSEQLIGVKLTHYNDIELSKIKVSVDNTNIASFDRAGQLIGMLIDADETSLSVQNSSMAIARVNNDAISSSIGLVSAEISTTNEINIVGNTLEISDSSLDDFYDQISTATVTVDCADTANLSNNGMVISDSILAGRMISSVRLKSLTELENATLSGNSFTALDISLSFTDVLAASVNLTTDQKPNTTALSNNSTNINTLSIIDYVHAIGAVQLIQSSNGGSLHGKVENNSVQINNIIKSDEESTILATYAAYINQSNPEGDLEAIASSNQVSISKAQTIGNVFAAYVDQEANHIIAESNNNLISLNAIEQVDGNIIASSVSQFIRDWATAQTSNNTIRVQGIENLQNQSASRTPYIAASSIKQTTSNIHSNTSAIANNNNVEIVDSMWAGNAYAAHISRDKNDKGGSAQAINNTLILQNSLVLEAAATSLTYYDDIQASSNTVYANHAQALEIYGAKVSIASPETKPTSLNIDNNNVFLYNSSINKVFAAAIISDNSYVNTGYNNTIYAAGVNEVAEINGFNTLVLTADQSINAKDAVLTFSPLAGYGNTQTLAQRNIPTSMDIFDKTIVLTGDLDNVIFMASADNQLSYQFKNTTLQYQSEFFEGEIHGVDLDISSSGNKQLSSESEVLQNLKQTLRTNHASEILSQTRVAELSWINQGAEFVADSAMPAAAKALTGKDSATFAAISGSNVHYETGSYVDMNGFNFAGGLSSRMGETIVTGFVEYGHANSDQYNTAAEGQAKHDYVGLGVAAQQSFNQWRLDAALRLGQSTTEFNGIAGTGVETDSFYVTAHAGAAYTWPITKRLSTELYSRYTMSYLDATDDRTGDTFNSRFESQAITSHALRVGARVMGSVEEKLFWKAGLAYEYVFDAETDDTLASYDIESAAVDGGSGVLEATVTLKPSAESPWAFEFGAKGYAGTREGVTGNLLIKRTF